MIELPKSDESERGVLSCCIQDPNLIGDCIERIGDEVFFFDLRRERIYRLFVEMFQEEKVGYLLIRNKLKDSGLLDGIGGDVGLSALQDYEPSTAMLQSHLDILENKATHRKLIHAYQLGLEKAVKGDNVSDILDEAERDILSVRPIRRKSKDISALIVEAMAELEASYTNEAPTSGLTTGLDDLDRLTDGLHGGEFVCLAAFPSCGKSTLAMNITETNVLKGIPAGVMSAEMNPVKMAKRSLCSVSGVNHRDVKGKNLLPDSFTRIGSAALQLKKTKLYIENASGMSIQQVHAVARRLKQRHDIKLLVIDYIQLLHCKADSREQEVSGISKGCKAIAMELDIPVLALSQLNDDGKLRESRAIGQDADSVWILENDGEWLPDNQPVKLNVIKNREGETGQVKLLFKKTITKFCNAARDLD